MSLYPPLFLVPDRPHDQITLMQPERGFSLGQLHTLDRNCDSKHGYKAYNGYSGHVRTRFSEKFEFWTLFGPRFQAGEYS